MVRGIRWNILVKSMRILRFLTLKKPRLGCKQFWVAYMLAGSSTKYWIYGSRWNRRSVSGAVLPCRSAENTVWSTWFLGRFESYWSLRAQSCGLRSLREKSGVHTTWPCRIWIRVAILFSWFWRHWVWSGQLFLWITLLHQQALC